jgi:hypothetical protein
MMPLIHKIPPTFLYKGRNYPSLAKRGEGRFSGVRVNSILRSLIYLCRYYWEHILGYIFLLALLLTPTLSPFEGRGSR